MQALQDNKQAPQLPASYPAMVLLALVPPLFFAVVDARLDRYKAASIAAEDRVERTPNPVLKEE